METSTPEIITPSLYEKKLDINFPEGLPAFETVTEFVLFANEEEAPFLWLQAKEIPNLAFIMIDPFLIYPEYRPDISDEDIEALGIISEKDVLLLSMVTIRNTPKTVVTTNMVSPIVINWKEQVGKQTILKNHLDYSLKHLIDQNG